MSGKNEQESPIKEWLSTGAAQSLIKQAARSVLRIARERRYSFTFIGLGSVTTLANGFLLEDIESALNLFILENRRGIQEKLLITGPKGGRVLQLAFIQDWIDATRTRESDQWRYLYKRSVAVIRNAKDIYRKKVRERATFYSLAENNVTTPEPTTEDISSIEFPITLLSSVTFKELNKADVLLAAARHFWREISDHWGGKPIWIPVKTLINWIAIQVPLETEQKVEGARNQQGLLERIPDDSLSPETSYLDREQIVLWAEKFANSLEKDERHALSLQHGDGLTLAEVAKKLGYR